LNPKSVNGLTYFSCSMAVVLWLPSVLAAQK
jgi:hypothetical protein